MAVSLEDANPMSDDDKILYPAYRFHPTLGMTRVETRADDETLKAGDTAWVNTPAELAQKKAAPPPPVPSPYAGYQTAAPETPPPAAELDAEPPPAPPKKSHHKKKAA